MKKVLADFADDADFSGGNVLKFFSRKVAKCFAKYAKIFNVFLSSYVCRYIINLED